MYALVIRVTIHNADRTREMLNARAAGDRVSAVAATAGDDVTLDSVEVRKVVASA